MLLIGRRLSQLWRIARTAVMGFIADDALSRGAAIAYYSIFAIAPILLIVIAVAGFFFGQEAAQNAIIHQFGGLMGPQAAGLVQQMINSATNNTAAGVLGTALGIAAVILSATGVFGEMQTALNVIWKAKPSDSPISLLLRARLASLGLVFALGFLLVASLAASAALSAVGEYLGGMFPGLPTLLAGVDLILSLGLITLIVGAIYKFLPDTPIRWRDVAIGAAVTALLLTAGKWLIGFYVGSSALASSYGTASALVVILVWVYYCAQIFLVGAEFTHAYAQREGSHASERQAESQRGDARGLRHS